MILSGATNPGQSRPGSDGNEGVFCIPQSSSDCLLSYQDTLYWEFYPSAEMQSVYSTAPANRATGPLIKNLFNTTEKKHVWSIMSL